jgi:hypothetical protein
MPAVRVDLSEALFDRLRRECDLLGFEDVTAYVHWVVDNRATIRSEADPSVVEAYERRIEELETRVGKLADGDADLSESETQTTSPESETQTTSPESRAQTTSPESSAATADDGGDLAGIDRGGDERVEANLSPATARVGGDADEVAELASALAGVTDDRLDEITRRAVARTREELGEGDGGASGLSYDATNALCSDGPPPGADITDLGALDVPGRDEGLVERRQRAVGAALAFLKEASEACRSDFIDALYETCPAGYDTADGWWRCVRRGLSQVDRVDGAGEGSRTWRFRDVRGRVRVL